MCVYWTCFLFIDQHIALKVMCTHFLLEHNIFYLFRKNTRSFTFSKINITAC